MIYCDTPYLARAYLHETGYEDVRRLMQTEDSIGSCLLGRVELVSVFHRNLREKRITQEEHQRFLALFEEDCRNNVWTWFPFDAELAGTVADVYRHLSASIFLRAVALRPLPPHSKRCVAHL
jgi:hypothetical protein